MIYGINLLEVLLPLIVLTALIIVLFSSQITSRYKSQTIKQILVVIFVTIAMLLALSVGPTIFFLNFVLILFSILVFLTGFFINRKYIYISAILFLVIAAIINTIGLEKEAEYLAVLCYLLLVLGVTKDVLYEKIFKNN